MPPVDHEAAVRRYLAPFASSPWRWDDGAEVIAWLDGQTIAFRGEVAGVLARLAPRGLPPFPALALLLAACRESWPGESNRLVAVAGCLPALEPGEFRGWVRDLFQQLDAVRALPAELRATPPAKADLAELVFEECRIRTSPEEAEAVRSAVSGHFDAEMLAPQADLPRRAEGALRELRCLYEGLRKLDVQTLRLRRRTGLDQLVRPAEVDLPPAEAARRLITRLHDDEDLGGMARIARRLLAAIRLPHALSDREDLPVGGISDISNRGRVDRLLLSELAQDDLTLAVRIALGEALYLRREAPPRNPPRCRAVLIDAGIRLWGVPRVFAAAVALSLVATSDRAVHVDAFRACGRSVEPVNLTHREGLLAHLEALEPEAHPGGALEAFLAAVSKRGDLLDAVIVTGEDVAADPQFQQAIASLEGPPLLLATVGREGRFRLVSWGVRSRKVLREARLDLEKLLAPVGRPVARLLDEASLATPAILRQRPFPLLLAYPPLDARRAWAAPGGGVLALLRNGSLVHRQRPGRRACAVEGRLRAWCLSAWSRAPALVPAPGCAPPATPITEGVLSYPLAHATKFPRPAGALPGTSPQTGTPTPCDANQSQRYERVRQGPILQRHRPAPGEHPPSDGPILIPSVCFFSALPIPRPTKCHSLYHNRCHLSRPTCSRRKVLHAGRLCPCRRRAMMRNDLTAHW